MGKPQLGAMMNEWQRVWAVCLLGIWMASACAGESRWDQSTPPLSTPVKIRVHRSGSCTCCGKWLQHMKQHGFQVEDVLEDDMDAVKDRLGIPQELRSCHTAEVSDHVVEGHVPAGDIKRLLGSKSGPYGLSVPGMPVGTPGMEMGNRRVAFSVIGFDRHGKKAVYSEYRDE
jgi:hypothetical protein